MFTQKRYKRRNKKKRYFAYSYIFILFALIMVIYGFILVDKKIKPTVLTIAEIKAKEIASSAVNESIREKITDDIRYQDLYFIRTDGEGNITFMQANTIMMNKLASEVALTIQTKIRSTETSSIKVPMGNIFGSQLLAQYGPKINIRVTPIGRVNVDFFTEFQHSGINQTRHKIYLTVNTQVKTIIPFASTPITVQSTVPIAETIIVGRVPDNYINVPEKDFMNVIPDGSSEE